LTRHLVYAIIKYIENIEKLGCIFEKILNFFKNATNTRVAEQKPLSGELR